MTSKVTILGSNSAMPAFGRLPSAHYLQISNHTFLIDCGEGTQFTLYNLGLKRSRISKVFITHLHGDHLFGLPGLLTSFELSGRKDDLTIYGPAPLKDYIKVSLEGTGHHLSYKISIHELTDEGMNMIFEDAQVEVYSFPLQHRITCVGYLFKEKPKRRNIKKSIIEAYNPTIDEIKNLIAGQDLKLSNGETILREDCLELMRMPRSYAYCSDTKYDEALVQYIEGVTTLYHETTYLDEFENQAAERYHSTSKQAARIAKLAKVEQLIVGHFSSRYKNINPFKVEAESIFNPVLLAKEGLCFEI